MSNRGVEITQNISKEWIQWFFATSVLKKNMENAWVNLVFLIVIVNLASSKWNCKKSTNGYLLISAIYVC
jgi:hypothetical protein